MLHQGRCTPAEVEGKESLVPRSLCGFHSTGSRSEKQFGFKDQLGEVSLLYPASVPIPLLGHGDAQLQCVLVSGVKSVLRVAEGDELVPARHLEVEHPLLQEAGHEHGALLPGVEEDALRVGGLERHLQMDSRLNCAVVRVENMH